MKHTLIIACWLLAIVAIGAPIIVGNPSGIATRQAQVTQSAITNAICTLPDWASLTSDRAAYVADKATYTGTVATVSDNNTRQSIKQLAACVQDCQAQISDLKRVVLAIANQTTNNAIISQ